MTSTTPMEEAILKTDLLGRVRTPMSRREELLDEFERSGLSGTKFAACVGVNYPTFATWVQKRKKERGLYPAGGTSVPMETPERMRLLEVAVERTDPREAMVRVELPGGASLEISRGNQIGLVAQLLGALVEAGRSC